MAWCMLSLKSMPWVILHGNIGVAPCEKYHGVDEQCQKEIEQYTAYHHQQALPGRLGAELPRLCRLAICSLSIDSSIMPAILT